jgi:hypothetical protein
MLFSSKKPRTSLAIWKIGRGCIAGGKGGSHLIPYVKLRQAGLHHHSGLPESKNGATRKAKKVLHSWRMKTWRRSKGKDHCDLTGGGDVPVSRQFGRSSGPLEDFMIRIRNGWKGLVAMDYKRIPRSLSDSYGEIADRVGRTGGTTYFPTLMSHITNRRSGTSP